MGAVRSRTAPGRTWLELKWQVYGRKGTCTDERTAGWFDSKAKDHMPALLERELRDLLDRFRAASGVPGIAAEISLYGSRVEAQAGSTAVDGGLSLSRALRFQIGCITYFVFF